MALVDLEVFRNAWERAQALVEEREEVIDAVAEVLAEKREVTGEEVEQILRDHHRSHQDSVRIRERPFS